MQNEIQEKIKAITAIYTAQLPEKIDEMIALWEQLTKENSKETFDLLLRAVHTLSGTAGTYGYAIVSDAARHIEQQLLQSTSHSLHELDQTDIENHLHDLKQLILNPPDNRIDPIFDFEMTSDQTSSVIYIFDNENNETKAFYEYLKQFNYQVRLFDQAKKFIDAVFSDHPKMIIIDMNLLNELQKDVLHKIREELILIVYFANQDDLETRLISVRSGGQALIVKPFESNSAIRTIDNLFDAAKYRKDRILIVDDSELLADYYALVLEHAGLVVHKVIDPRVFLNTLQEFQPDLILLDVNMPFCSGVELAQIVHQQENLSGIPIIFLSTIAERNRQLDMLSIAGDDFLTKPIDPKHLIAAVRNRLMRSHMLRSRMMRDSLTNLYNHTMIHHQLEREILIAERYRRPLSIALLDIDHFKEVNDTYGHQAGDKILKDLSNFLQIHLRKSDLIGRYGGEEFLIVLPNLDLPSAKKLIDDLRKAFSQTSHVLNQKEIYVTISGGIADYPRFNSVSSLVKASDDALYDAKEHGRNQIKAAADI